MAQASINMTGFSLMLVRNLDLDGKSEKLMGYSPSFAGIDCQALNERTMPS